MTPEDWKKVESELRLPFGRATLLVDGYELTLQVKEHKPLRFVICVYVNGWMKGEWLLNDCEERRRFMRPKKCALYTPAQRAKLTKGFTKRQVAKYFADVDKKFDVFMPYWSSASSLKRHLVANNRSIELQKCGP